MTIWTVAQFALNLMFIAGIALCMIKVRVRREEDPRLSYGLKLLQNKLAILEDLSDKTDHQVKQLMTLLESKMRDLQARVHDADNKLKAIDQAVAKNMEAASIFREQMPHEQIVEQKVTSKYVNAARMAHQGYTREQIRAQIDLPDAELDLIMKVNRDQLMFSEEALPVWVEKHPLENNPQLFIPPQVDLEALSKMGDDFKKACEDFARKADQFQAESKHQPEVDYFAGSTQSSQSLQPSVDSEAPVPPPAPQNVSRSVSTLASSSKPAPTVVPYQFKRYDDIV